MTMIYQAKSEAVIVQPYRWAIVKYGDSKIKWISKFSGMADALGKIGFYQLDSNKRLITDAKGLATFEHDWEKNIQIHDDEQQLKNDFSLSFEI